MEKLKFLVIRFSSIGDIVLTTPVLRLIKAKYPDSELHFVTKTKMKAVVEHNPHIDHLHLLGDSFKDLKLELSGIVFDYVIDLHSNLRSRRLCMNVRVKSFRNIFHLDKLNFRKFLYTTFKMQCMPDVHITDREVDTLKKLGITNDHAGLEYYVSAADETKANELTADIRDGYVAFVIGATYYTKRMPAQLIASIADRLKLPVVLVGGPGDAEAAQVIESECSRNKILNLCSKLPLNVSASIVKHASLVIAHDTGLMHIAAAFKKDIITIWGNTTPELGMYACEPGSGSRDFQVAGLKCRPCSKLGGHKCPKGHFKCMMDQDVELIADYANKVLTKD